jgi:hypothetical protein
MTEDELREVDEALREQLDELGLGWVAQQVDQAIREERMVAVQPTQASDYGAVPWAPSPRVRFEAHKATAYTTEPYTLEQRVALLIQGIRRAFSDYAAVESTIAAFLAHSEQESGPRVLQFVDDTDTISPHTFDAEITPDRRLAISRLLDSLDELLRQAQE